MAKQCVITITYLALSTGWTVTRASCFNLVTSVHSGGRYIVAFVMGGHSSFERDAYMHELISVHIKQALSPWQWVGRCQA